MSLAQALLRTKAIDTDLTRDRGLKRVLGAWDLTLLGVGAIIGAGIFVLTGITAATMTGPAIVLSFVVAGFACACAALSYAEMAASIGGCGSAYGYGYASLGEFPAWIIGWMLICEYGVAIPAVSAGWSGYAVNGLAAIGVELPAALTAAPAAGGLINLPAFLVVLVLGGLLAVGAKVSSQFNAIMVAVKVAAIAIFIGVAFFHVEFSNWTPFIPEAITREDGSNAFGVAGIFTGAATIFFAYLGFDAVSTAAEETRNPARDLPIGILGSLFACTALYILVSGLLTGIVPYTELNVASPVAHALLKIGVEWAAGLISIGAIAGLTTVMLVMYFGLTRILFAMAQDGLLPGFFGYVNPKTGTPLGSIVVAGLIMLVFAGFVPLGRLAEIANIGTLGAFVVVCFGVVVLRQTRPDLPRPFKTPLSPLIPVLGVLSCGFLMSQLSGHTWTAFLGWMGIGIALYFLYGQRHSRLSAA
ncbi:MAG TPA: amino acid permease [Nevskiaceae bacterium]|nr:amino acid permease [Nevskiaceae bacterium]